MPGVHRHPPVTVQGIPRDVWVDALRLARAAGTTRNALVRDFVIGWVVAAREREAADGADAEMMSDLHARILARLDEIEVKAKVATLRDGPSFRMHDPPAMLRLVAGLRQVVNEHVEADGYCSTCGDVPQVRFPCVTLTALAVALGVDDD